MRAGDGLVAALLLVVLTIASYVDRLYSELGKFLAREFQENIDCWEQEIEPRMGMPRERIALSAAVLAQFSLGCLALLLGRVLFDRPAMGQRVTGAEIAQAILAIVLAIVLCNRLLPYVFFTRTRGEWLVRWRWLLKPIFYVALPVTLFIQFLQSIAALAEPQVAVMEEDSSEGVDALIEAGEEEGILEASDRELVRSAVEFGDKVVREVMTPRPDLFAVPGTLTLANLIDLLEAKPYSRIPVFEGALDRITGIIFAHDLLRIRDEEARTRTVASLQRPASFVPETKKVNELLREMQREKQHLRIVIDEYGGVAGLVTIEDLLEEIVGSITDEHEQGDELEGVVREGHGVFVLPGNLELDRLEEIFGTPADFSDEHEATTVGGLVSEIAGRIPLAGEVVEHGGFRFETVASTDRRIDRLRVSRRTGV